MKWLILLAFCACSSPPRPRLELTANEAPPAYDDALSAWTRKAEAYENFESRVFVRATWFSPAFAASYAAQRSQRLGHSPAEVRTEQETQVAAARQEVRLFVAVVTNDPYWNDLERGEAATMRARLLEPASVQAPRISRISDDELADLRPFFPYADPLTRGYWMTFPMPEAGVARGLHLRIAGPPAIVDLHWEVR